MGQRREKYTTIHLAMVDTDAWRALCLPAQALYPVLALEWKGPKANNNGQIQFSTRQAAEAMGANHKTANRALHDLQAKGFIAVTKCGHLGAKGHGKAHSYELTEHPLPTAEKPVGRKLYRDWRNGKDFDVVKAKTNNPKGRNGKTEPQPVKGDVTSRERGRFENGRPVKGVGTSRDMGRLSRFEPLGRPVKGDTLKLPGGVGLTVPSAAIGIPSNEGHPPDLSLTAGLYLCPMLIEAVA